MLNYNIDSYQFGFSIKVVNDYVLLFRREIMNIYVLLKRTFDTEEKITLSGGKINDDGATFIINPYDEYAVEEAIKLRDEHGGEITVISVGEDESVKQIHSALAMGADKAVLIDTDDLDEMDQYTTSRLIHEYLKDKEVDLIIAGNVAIDGGSGQVGPRIAELLDMPYVTSITKFELNERTATITRDVEGDTEIVEVALPVLVTAQQGLNEPRYPSLAGIMKAKKKPLEELEVDDLDIDEDDVEPKTKAIEIYLPPKKEAGKILAGEMADQVKELVGLLRNEAKVI